MLLFVFVRVIELFESHLVLSEYLNADLVVPVAAYLIGHVHAPF